MQIAAVASQCQVAGIIRATVLPCDNMFHVVGQFAIFLAQMAILATFGGTAPHKFPRGPDPSLLNR